MEVKQMVQNTSEGSRKSRGINSSVLKWIALGAMLIDHFGAAVFILYTSYYDGSMDFLNADLIYSCLRIVGRTSFPIFCFCIVEGFFHTRSVFSYVKRLFVFCIVSEIPFDLAFRDNWYDFRGQNVFFTLLLGLLAVAVLDFVMKKLKQPQTIKEGLLQGIIRLAVVACFMAAAYFMKTDYDMHGVLLIVIFYLLHNEKNLKCICGYLVMCWEAWCFPAFILIRFYNGRQGKKMKYFFYLFYPIHLLILYGVRLYLKG